MSTLSKEVIAFKINDLRDNMDITRLPQLTTNDLHRLNKYLRAYKKLVNSE